MNNELRLHLGWCPNNEKPMEHKINLDKSPKENWIKLDTMYDSTAMIRV